MGIPLRGRDFTLADRDGGEQVGVAEQGGGVPVAVVGGDEPAELGPCAGAVAAVGEGGDGPGRQLRVGEQAGGPAGHDLVHPGTPGVRVRVVADPSVRYFGATLDDRSLTPGAQPRIGATAFADWLREHPRG
jgi:hypothetical protein